MIIKLTTTVKNEPIYVNFDYVRTMRRDGAFTELVMSDDKYHKLSVLETHEEIYSLLYPPKTCSGNCHCHDTSTESVILPEAAAVEAVEPKKTTAKKSSTKNTETN